MRSRIFQTRQSAGEKLALGLSHYRNDPNAVVFGLPNGGIAVAAALSEALNLPLTVFIARELRAPCDVKCVLGAIAETAHIYIDEDVLCLQPCLSRDLRAYIEHESEVQRGEILRLRHVYRDGSSLEGLDGKTAILVDEGMTTGATFFVAADGLRSLGVNTIVAAIPVAPAGILREVYYKVDALAVLERAGDFGAVHDYYAEPSDTSDDMVRKILDVAAASSRLRRDAKPPRTGAQSSRAS